MRVSVVIPVYNAEPFIERAVNSALDQRQTRQIVLVEDGSTDGSLDVCRNLAEEHAAVSLFTHDDGGNHGAGATRNLGLRMAEEPFIAFLDADDYYLDDRFGRAEEIFGTVDDADGVYEAIGADFQNDSARQVWSSKGDGELTTISREIPPERLMDAMLDYDMGTISPDGLVFRKEVLWRPDPFCPRLRLHQDTAMIIQLSYYGRLYPGRIHEPVAMRYVHDEGRYLSHYNINRTRTLMWDYLFRWARSQGIRKRRTANIFRNALYFRYLSATGRFSEFSPRPQDLPGLFWKILVHPFFFLLALKEHGRRRCAGVDQ